MTLRELLRELRENILHDRSHRVGGDSDLLWSDETLVRYIDEAQRRLARQGLVIRDAQTPEVCRVQLVENVRQYDLHPSVVAVVSARLEDSARDLVRVGHMFLNGYQPPDQHVHSVAAYADLPPGRVIAYSTDESISATETDSFDAPVLRVFPAPRADALVPVLLRVVRMPLDRLSVSNLDAVPEVPSDFHLPMLDWAAYLALRMADIDAGLPQRAAEFRASFELTVAEARKVALRKMFAPKGWGFGRGGWIWEA